MKPTMQLLLLVSFAIVACIGEDTRGKKGQMRCTRDMKDGPCRALIKRFFYNMTTGKCEQFWYGGCDGNKNNFDEENVCNAICAGVRKEDKCSLNYRVRECREPSVRYYYDKNTGECKKVQPNQCQKNQNYFLGQVKL
uniref:Putative secreted salivary protease inhibitor n=1 Tax=Ixodes scapularis TaxID=6945 RepID=Q4PMN8_IXOSC|nr:putative secreted salivary protease inhibitor [Ixodes scapularis]